MIVSEISALSGGRYKVYIDQEFAFVLYKGELRLYKVIVGEEIAEKDYCEIVERVLPKRAKLRVMNLLQKRQYTEKQLVGKLQEGFYSEEIITQELEYVKSYGYVNDKQFALDYITYHEGSKTERRMIQDLRQRGISESDIKGAFAEWNELGGSQDELKMIRELLEKKKYRADGDLKEKQRVYAFLLRKGFSSENVNKVLGGMDSYA